MKSLSIIRPDDWHVHFRDNDYLNHTVPATARHFSRALIMPNLQPALTTVDKVIAYHQRIEAVHKKTANVRQDTLSEESRQASDFMPYMTLYLNDTVKPEEMTRVKQHAQILGAKLYPAGATTNSAEGATSILGLYPLFEAMQQHDLVLQIHGEVTQGDIFEREADFIQTHLTSIVKNFPKLRIVLEHISSRAAVDFVMQAPATVAATITPHHLLFNRNQLLAGGIRPHYYCLPILKHANDQHALQQAAVSGNPKFFAGTDSAPHVISQKESACGCAGVYSAPFALCMYTQIFEKLNKLDKLEAFLSRYGAFFYQLPILTQHITLIKQQQMIPLSLPFGQEPVVPLAAGSYLQWSVRDA